MGQKNPIVIGVILLIVGLGVGYFIGQGTGYKSGYQKGDNEGYKRAETDIKKLEEEAAKRATGEAARAANPFQVTNPLEGVEANPFQKAKKVLNPFE